MKNKKQIGIILVGILILNSVLAAFRIIDWLIFWLVIAAIFVYTKFVLLKKN